MLTYFSTRLETKKNKKELAESLHGLLRKSENRNIRIFPRYLFDAAYYRSSIKRIKSPYYGEINDNEFTLEKRNYDDTRSIIVAGKIVYETDNTVIHLNFKTTIFHVFVVLFLLLSSIGSFIWSETQLMWYPLAILTIWCFSLIYHYLKIRRTITGK